MSASELSALAAWAAVALAVVGGLIAYRQLAEARRVRLEQAQPYVAVFLDESAAGSWVIELVVKNFGATAAHDVAISIEPPPRRAASGAEEVVVPTLMPVLVPGQEWRTLWDTGIARADSDLPDLHHATVRFRDSHNRQLSYEFDLDWRPLKGRDVVAVFGSHHAAEALREIKNGLASWRESAAGGLKVFVRDGEKRDAVTKELVEQRRAETEDSGR